MFIYFCIGITTFLIGALLSYVICKINFSKKTNLSFMLNDLKNTIEKFEYQNLQNTKEVKDSIKEAEHLAKLLTTNQNLKGKFGEDCLESIIKFCYPNENIHYIKQFNSTNSDGKQVKPDFLIKLPNNKAIAIDCKLNLEKYIDYKECNEKELSKIKKNEFIKDINNTINLLSNKKYETIDSINQTDFILMYIPLEPVITTIYTDNDFSGVIKNAIEKNIIIVGNSSVLTTLKLVKSLWAQEKQEKNIEKIVDLAQNIYDYIAKHSQNLYEIKQTLEENTNRFNKEYEKLTKSNILFKKIEELKEYGISASNKKIGKNLIELEINKDFLDIKK